jgi:hypothetical protein
MKKFQIIVEDKTLWAYTVEAENAEDAKKQVQDVIDGNDDGEVELPCEPHLHDQGYSEVVGLELCEK